MLGALPALAADPGYTYTVTATIGSGGTAQSVAVDPDTQTAYVANASTNTVSVIDESTNTVTHTIAVGDSPEGTAVDPVTNTIYVTNSRDNTVSVINGATNAVTATIGVGNIAFAIAVNPDTDTIYVANAGDNTITVIDGATNAVTTTITGVPSSYGVAVDPGTNTVYASNAANETVTVIDGTTNTVTQTIAGFFDPEGVAVNPVTETVYVANDGSSTVSVIDESTNTVTGTISVGDAPVAVAVDASSNTIYAANLNSHTVSVADGSTNLTYATVSTGVPGEGNAVAVDPTTHTAYAAYASSVAVISRGMSTTTTSVTTSGPVAAGSAVTLTAIVSPAPDAGTVGFTVNGDPVSGCTAQSVDPVTGEATCATTAPTRAGSYPVAAAYTGGGGYDPSAGSATLSVTAGPVASLAIAGGNGQSAVAGRPFGTPLSVTVTDSHGNPMAGATVTFAVSRARGGTARFAGRARTVTAISDSAGVATAPVLYAGLMTGPVAVTASTPAGSGTARVTFRETVIKARAARADLAITMAAPRTVAAGGRATVTIIVANKGPQAAVHVDTVFSPPVGLIITSAGGGTILRGRDWFTEAALPARHKVIYTVGIRARPAWLWPGRGNPRLLLRAATRSSTPDPRPWNNATTAIVTVTRR